jgi:hypothetical protein
MSYFARIEITDKNPDGDEKQASAIAEVFIRESQLTQNQFKEYHIIGDVWLSETVKGWNKENPNSHFSDFAVGEIVYYTDSGVDETILTREEIKALGVDKMKVEFDKVRALSEAKEETEEDLDTER